MGNVNGRWGKGVCGVFGISGGLEGLRCRPNIFFGFKFL